MANSTDEEQLAINVIAKLTDLEKQMAKASGITAKAYREMSLNSNRATRQMEQDAIRSTTRINQALATTSTKIGAYGKAFIGYGKLAAGAFLGSAVVAGAAKYSEAATRIDNALKVAGLSGEKLNDVYDKLRDSAVKNAAPLESLVELYGRASLVQKDLGVSSNELISFTDKVALALRVSGKSAQESSGALLQLSQALGSGVVRAEEFNSIVEGAPTILQAAARGIKEAGGSVSELRKIMLDGGLSSKALFDGFIAGSGSLAEKVSDVQLTFGQSMENMQTALIDTAREFNTSTGASAKFAGGINNVAKAITDFDVTGFITKIQKAGGAVEVFLNNVGNSDVFTKLNQLMGVMDEAGNVINPDVQAAKDKTSALEREVDTLQKTIEKNTSLGFDNTEALARLAEVKQSLAEVRGGIASIPATLPNPSKGDPLQIVMHPNSTDRTKDDSILPGGTISINDPKYKPPVTPPKPKKAKAPKAATSAPRTADSRFSDDIQDVKDRTAALQEEIAMVGLSYEAQEKRRMALDLEQHALADLREEARKKGETDLASIKLSDDQIAKIDAVSAAYAQQAATLREVQAQQDRNEQASGEFYDTFKSGAIDAVTGAKSLGEALSDLTKKFQDMLLNSAFDALFKPASGGASGGIFGSLFSGIGSFLGGGFGGGSSLNYFPPMPKFAKGGIANEPSIISEFGQAEAAVPLPDGRRIPVDLGNAGSASKVPTPFNLKMDITVKGNGDAELHAQMRQTAEETVRMGIENYDRHVLPDSVNRVQGDPHRRG